MCPFLLSFTLTEITGTLVLETGRFGLLWVDRARLFGGIAFEAPGYAAERAWRTWEFGVPLPVLH